MVNDTVVCFLHFKDLITKKGVLLCLQIKSYSHRFAVEKWETDLKAIGQYILKHPEKKDYITLTIPYKKDKN